MMIPLGVPAGTPEPRAAGRLGPSSIFHVSKFHIGHYGPSGGTCKVEQPARAYPTLVRLLGCGSLHEFDTPEASEAAADHRSPVACKNLASRPVEPHGGVNELPIVIGLGEPG